MLMGSCESCFLQLPGATTVDALEPTHQSWGPQCFASPRFRSCVAENCRETWLSSECSEFGISPTSPISPIDQWFQTYFSEWWRSADFEATSGVEQKSAQALGCRLSPQCWPSTYGGFLQWGTPKSSIFMGFSPMTHPFWGTPHLWKTPCIKILCVFFDVHGVAVQSVASYMLTFELKSMGLLQASGPSNYHFLWFSLATVFSYF